MQSSATRPTPETTEEHLRLYNLPARNTQELEWLDRVYRPLILKISRQDLIYDFDGTPVRLEYRIDRNIGDTIRDWWQTELQPALLSARQADRLQPSNTAGTNDERVGPTDTDTERGSRLFGDSVEIINLAKKLLER